MNIKENERAPVFQNLLILCKRQTQTKNTSAGTASVISQEPQNHGLVEAGL